ncbi:aminotransferase class V-fold PLP-dependent enzyme [Nocardioides sp. MAH-18]|uniref:Kynureninase n=1 Tax=Nocardioides agri TaxID=2682843 RepID=A0A6L6XN55_9ACTN|nr:aminotransferase class V-fold PLP-dependent enzyme [Nocardioides sp. CGMCC 1.13656]MBA2953636.1 aminotransferase class V-fold PLP-dependent enzyme [Nocardioides sp. CGMCC 1.13656]MVQ48500.1 aminotransferase class V-fold PLP-dependent enzyme [Nocardioides sp. MAH-18]
MTHRLDATDPLASYRDRFVGAETSLVYFDGNSLGRPLRATGPRLAGFVEEEWGGRLIRGWDERWLELPQRIGDDLGRVLLGAAPGQATIGDSTTVLLYKLMRAAVAGRPGRSEIVLDRDNFPTDRYVADGVARECGLTLRWIDVDVTAGVTAEQLAEVVGPQTALVVLSHVAYRSAWLADVPELTRIAHEAGALVLWDLCHSAGSVPTSLDAWGVDLAVGCTYKYLNGGPGAPAFCYVASSLLDELTQPIQGWLGSVDPFLMGPSYVPAPGIRRFQSGTPPIVGMLALQDMVALIDEAGIEAVREKSVALTSYAVEVADSLLAPAGVVVASPRDPARRGGHVTLQHPLMREVTSVLWERDVIPDYRDPGGLRIGLSPLSTSFAEVERGLEMVRAALAGLTA